MSISAEDIQKALQGGNPDKLALLWQALMGETNGAIDFLDTRGSLKIADANTTVFGSKAIAALIAPEALGDSGDDDVRAVWVFGLSSNTQTCFIGDVSAQVVEIPNFGAGAPYLIPAKNINDIYIRSQVNGEGVMFMYSHRE